MDAWYYEQDGKPAGPISRAELDALATRGQLGPETRVWAQGMPDWVAYRDVTPAQAAGTEASPLGEGERPAFWSGDATAEDRPGLPWEREWEGGAWGAFWATVGAVLMRPSEAFAGMRLEGGTGKALGFAILGIMAGTLVLMASNYAFERLMGSGPMAQQPLSGAIEVVGLGVALAFMVLVGPVVVCVVLCLAAGIVHAVLKVMGGTARPFDATLRVLAYSAGATGLLNGIPICSGFLAAIWNIVSASAGLEQIQGVSRGKGVFAMSAPMILCCGLTAMLVAAMFAAVFSKP